MPTMFSRYRSMLLCWLVLAVAGLADAADWGPLFSSDETLSGACRWRALGPLIEVQSDTNGMRLCAVRPFFSRETDGVGQKTEQDVLWPVWTGKVYADEDARWRFLILVSWHDFDRRRPDSHYAFRVFPLYFQGRDENGQAYMALFPLGGTIRDFIFYDDVKFWLFPVYLHTRVNDLDGTSWLWPIFSRDHSPDVERHRFFPFYGYSRRRDDFEKYFVLWPIWHYTRYNFPGAEGRAFMFFPLFGRVKLTDQSSWLILPPFFRFSGGARQNEVLAPWPFIQLGWGEVEKAYFWPLLGKKHSGDMSYGFFVWPICVRTLYAKPNEKRGRFWVLPFVYAAHVERPAPQCMIQRQRKFWPIFTWRQTDAHTCLRIPTLLPFRDFEPIDRNFAPLWTLYSREATADAVEHELLWGIWRYRRNQAVGMMRWELFPLLARARSADNDAQEWALLKGLFGWRQTKTERRLKLLYFIDWNLTGADQAD